MKNYRYAFLGFLALHSLESFADTQPLNSFQKIDVAIQANKVSVEDGVGYKVLAFFGDSFLPAEYANDPGAPESNPSDLLVNQAIDLLPKMTESVARAVYTHMIPPPYRPKQSHSPRFLDTFDDADFPKPEEIPSGEWAFVDHIGAGIRVWYEKDNNNQFIIANRIKNALGGYIVDQIKGLMGRTHLPDNVVNSRLLVRLGIDRAQPNGGDGKLDVYLFNITPDPGKILPARAWVQVYDLEPKPGYGCPSTASYMAVDYGFATRSTPERLATTLAHEYFHVIQNTYDRKVNCVDYHPTDEGVATYIKDYVYPNYNHEHEWYEFFEDGAQSFLGSSYDTWYFYKFMKEMQGASVFQELYNAEGSDNDYESLNKVLKGGFKDQWLEFAVYNWNQAPLMDGFKQWDKINFVPGRAPKAAGHLTPIPIEKVTLDINGHYSKQMDLNLPPLTRDFYAFDVSNSEIRTVAVDNPVFFNTKKARMKVLIKRKGQNSFDEVIWEDNKRHQYDFCFDKKDEQMEQMVFVFVNYQHKKNAPTFRMTPMFKVSNQGCNRFSGKMTARLKTANQDIEVDATDVVMKESGHNDEGIFKGHFHMESAKISYTYTGTIDGCRGVAAGYLTPDTSPKEIAMGMYPWNVPPEAWGSYNISIPMKDAYFMVNYVCPPPKKSFEAPVSVLLSTGAENHGGFDHLKDRAVFADWVINWDFNPIRE